MRVDSWLDTHTWTSHDWPPALVGSMIEASGTTVAVVLPALNEEATVGQIVAQIAQLMGAEGWVHELVVVDSGSTDETAAVAAAAGARVVRREEVLTELPPVPGKGEAMWRGLAATTSDIVVFVDADLQSFSTDYISGLTGPLLADSGLQLVKAIYERPLVAADQVVPAGGGRVTELMARPLINRFWPELADMVQPLAGEYAGRRTLLESLPFPCGYGIELALMVDTYQRHGMAALGQVDLGVRVHRHHHTPGLGLMAAEILDTALRRVNPGDPTQQNPPELTQFERTRDGFRARRRELSVTERPPLRDIR